MTLDDLYAIITNKDWYSGGTLALPATAVDKGGPVFTLLNKWLGDTLHVLDIQQAPQKKGDTITIIGTMNLLNVKNVKAVSILFSIFDANNQPATDGTPALFIDFPLPDAWTFTSSFPALESTAITQLFFKQARFLLSSYEQEAMNDYPALSEGLTFYTAALQTDNGLLKVVTDLLGGNQPVSIYGSITILEGSIQNFNKLIPGVDLLTPVQHISLARFLSLPVYLQCKSTMDRSTEQLSVTVLLCSQVSIASRAPIGLSVDITNVGKVVVFAADTACFVQHSLQDLSSFLNHAPIGEELKKYISKLSNIVTLKGIRIYLTTQYINQSLSKAFSAVAIDVGSTSEWEVLPGYFDLKSFDATFMVNNIVSNPTVTTIVDGNVLLADQLDLLLSANFPDASFDVQLQSGSTVNLTQLFQKFLPAASGFPALICDQLDISGTPGQSTYTMSAGFTGNWQINSGVREIRLDEAVLSLNYDKSQTPTTSGSIKAIASFIAANGKDKLAEFMVNWDVHKSFQLQGDFPDISLKRLAQEIVNVAELSLPSDFPTLDLKDSTVTFTVINPAEGNKEVGTLYDFSLSSTVLINRISLQSIVEIQKNDQGWGFLAGIWTENWQWSPAQQWPDVFGVILKDISFSKSGLIISSLDNPTVAWQHPPSKLPSSIKKGLTFFTSIDLEGSALSVLRKFFPDASGVSFYAYLADPLAKSQFIGKIGNSSDTEKYSFDGLEFIISPASKSFSLQTGVTFSFTEIAGPNKGKTVVLDFIGGGTLNLEGAFDLYFVLKASENQAQSLQIKHLQRHTRQKLKRKKTAMSKPPKTVGWKDPLGLEGIVIEDFWGEIGVSIEGLLSFGFGGNVAIGETDPVELELDVVGGVEGEVPVLYVFVFKLIEEDQTKAIELTDLIKQFTKLDLSWVPVLNGIAFKQFQLYIVLDPMGWRNPATQTQYQMGFYASGDVSFYGFEAVFDIAIYFNTGIKAWGYINKPLSLADGLFKLSDASGEKGPYGLIDTTAISRFSDKPYLFLSGSITLLAFSDTLCAYIKSNAFYMEMTLHQFIFTEKVICSLSRSGSSFNFKGTVGGSIKLHLHTSKVELEGVEIIPPVNIDIDLDMSIVITINPGFTFHVNGSFAWGSLTLTVDFDLIEIKSWSDLEEVLTNYLDEYAEKLFRDLKNDVSQWISALKQGLFSVGDDVAKLLRNAFQVAAKDAAKLLNDLGWAAGKIEDALEKFWDKSEKEAEEIVSEILKFCAVVQAYGLFGQATIYTTRPDEALLQTLATAPGAQKILYHYYLNQEEIRIICSKDAEVRTRLTRMLVDHLKAEEKRATAVEEIITLLHVLKKKGSPALGAGIEPLLTLLRPYRNDHYDVFIKRLHEEPAVEEDYHCPPSV